MRQIGVFHGPAHGIFKAPQNGWRCGGWRRKGGPGSEFIARHTCLIHRWYIGQIGVPLAGCDGQYTHTARFVRTAHQPIAIHHQLYAPPQQILQGRAAAAIGHMDNIKPGALLQDFKGEMRHTARTARAEIQFAGAPARDIQEFLQRACRKICRHRNRERAYMHAADISKIADRIKTRIGKQRLRGIIADIAEEQRIAIGR